MLPPPRTSESFTGRQSPHAFPGSPELRDVDPMNFRKSSTVFALLVLLLVCTGFVIGRETSSRPMVHVAASPLRTDVQFVTPWTPIAALSPQEKVSSSVSGSCWTGSIAVDDSHAWRCASGNAVYDPCFAAYSYRPAEVVCLDSPWSRVVLLHLTKQLPTSRGNAMTNKSEPSANWALELSNGDHCVIGTGTASLLGGVRLPYNCSSGALAGIVNTTFEPWTVEYYRQGSGHLFEEDVRVAWGG